MVALPWLEAMTRPVRAQSLPTDGERLLRNVFIFCPNGMHMPSWTPEATENGGYKVPRILEPIADYQSQTTVLGNLTLNGGRALGDGPGDHARALASFLTGAHPKKTHGEDIRNGQSIDQRLAEVIGERTRLPSLEVGTEAGAMAGNCDSGYSCVYSSSMSWRNERSPVAKEVDPAAVFDRLFGNNDPNESQAARERRRRYRRSVLDFVAEDARSLHRDLGAGDRRKLDEYLYAVRQIEQRLEGVERLESHEVETPDYARPPGVPKQFAEHLKLIYELVALALQTDSTRVVSIAVANAGSNRGYREIEVPEGHHDLSHHGNDPDKLERIAKINTYHVSLLRHFLDRLSEAREGEHSLLDNSVVLYGSGLGDGNRHNHDDLPIALIGGAAGKFRPGWYRRYPDETPLTNVYLSMLRMQGLGDVSFSDSTGVIDELMG